MAKNYRGFLLAGLSGFLLALAYPGWPASWQVDFGFLVWAGFIPLLFSLSSSYLFHDREISMMKREGFLKSGFMIGFVGGLIYFLIILRWFWSIYPLNTLGIQNNFTSLVIVFLIYVISSAGMAVFWGLFGLVYSLQLSVIRKRAKELDSKNPISSKLKTENWTLITIPAIFVLLEYARSYGFGLLWAGSGTLFGPHWTLGNLAYALANNPLALGLVSYVGIYGVTFLIVLVNYLIFITFKNKQAWTFTRFTRMTLVIAAIIALITLGPKFLSRESPSSDKKINFAVIQTNQLTKISPTPKETLNSFKEQLDLLNQVAKEHPESQLIIFPEASDFFKNLSLFLTGAQIPNYFSNLFREPRLIIAGARVIDANNGRTYSRVFALDTKKDIIGFYDKRLLTPEGEFLSYPTKFIVNLLSKTKVSEFSGLRELGVGTKEISTVNFRGQFSVAPIICSELLAPSLVREATLGSDVIAGMASYGVFHGSTTLARQTLATARFRAAENQKPLITAANMGFSYAINSEGGVQFITQNQGAQILTGSIALNLQKPWYNRVGDLPIILVSLVLVIVFSLQLTVYRKIKTWLWRPK